MLRIRLLLIATILTACTPERENFYRGGTREVASLPATDLAAAYRAALAGSFTVSDPGLWILVDTLYLPRTEGLAGGTAVPVEQMRAIQALDVVKGSCSVPVQASRRGALVCDAAHPGYAVRFCSSTTGSSWCRLRVRRATFLRFRTLEGCRGICTERV